MRPLLFALSGLALAAVLVVAPVYPPSPGGCCVAAAATLPAVVAAPTAPAVAAAAATPAPSDVGALIAPLLGTLLTGLAGYLVVLARGLVASGVTWMTTHTDLTVSASNRALLDDLCEKGIKYVITDVTSRGVMGCDDSTLIQGAVSYVRLHAPDAVAYFGLDHDALTRMVTARLFPITARLCPVAPTPVVAPVPAPVATAPASVPVPGF
jgi:hypothetical protein